MSNLQAVVRHLIVCEDVLVDEANPRRHTLVGLIGALRSTGEPPFPLLYRELCAYIQLTGCRGPAEGRVEIQYADTGDLVIRTRSRTLPLPTDPPRRDGLQFSIAQLPVPTSWAVLGTILVQ